MNGSLALWGGIRREDYDAALQRHYKEGAPVDRQDSFVSAYATTHPWEDFVETFAHYLHMIDTLETAHAFGIRTKPEISTDLALATKVDFDPYRSQGIATLVDAWVPLTFAVNSVNRSMGQPDLYPFFVRRRSDGNRRNARPLKRRKFFAMIEKKPGRPAQRL